MRLYSLSAGFWSLLLVLGFTVSQAQNPVGPMDGGGSFEIIESGEGRMDQGPQGSTKTLSGGVVLRYRDWLLRCREVVLLDQDQIARATGKVVLQGKAGLRIQSERLLWNTASKVAFFEEDVRCKQGDWSLETPSLRLFTESSEAVYEQGGVLRQGALRIESRYGFGDLNRKDYRFKKQVPIRHPELDLQTEACRYLALPDCLVLEAPSRMVGLQGSMQGDGGTYQIKSKKVLLHRSATGGDSLGGPTLAFLQKRYLVAGDTLQLDQKNGAYRALGQAQWVDLQRKITLQGDMLALDSARNLPSTPPVPRKSVGRQGFWAMGRVRLLDESVQPALEWITESLAGWMPTPTDSLILWTNDSSLLAHGNWLFRSSTLFLDRQSQTLQAKGSILAWQGPQQLESTGMLWKNMGDSLSTLDFEGSTGLCEMADTLPWPLYHQAAGQKAQARMTANHLRDFELIGNTVTLYWTRGTDSLWSALSRTESARAVFEFQDQQLARARYLGGPRGTYTPLSLIQEAPKFLAGVRPQFELQQISLRNLEERRQSYPPVKAGDMKPMNR
ncbi:MAG: hypothetical protein RLZZ121_121 [Bacteroidota bacterium]